MRRSCLWGIHGPWGTRPGPYLKQQHLSQHAIMLSETINILWTFFRSYAMRIVLSLRQRYCLYINRKTLSCDELQTINWTIVMKDCKTDQWQIRFYRKCRQIWYAALASLIWKTWLLTSVNECLSRDVFIPMWELCERKGLRYPITRLFIYPPMRWHTTEWIYLGANRDEWEAEKCKVRGQEGWRVAFLKTRTLQTILCSTQKRRDALESNQQSR